MKMFLTSAVIATLGSAAFAEQYVLKTENPVGEIAAGLLETLKIKEVERFASDGTHFVVLDLENDAYLETFLNVRNLTPLEVSKVDFVNSPVVGGGEAAPLVSDASLQTFVIERPIAGVGSFPLAKKQGISKKSNAAIEKLGGSVEWVHSYLTEGGTYCVYRASDADKIAEHAQLAGAPLGPVTAVDHILPD